MAEQRDTPGPGEVHVHIAAGAGATPDDVLAALDRARAALADDTVGYGPRESGVRTGDNPENRSGAGGFALPGFSLSFTWPR